jgi:CBS domain-containing protein
MSQRSVVQLIKRRVIHLAPSASVHEAAQLMSGESDRFFTQSIFS